MWVSVFLAERITDLVAHEDSREKQRSSEHSEQYAR
jgi:hypothetical protein